jgi:hypothetical protein
MDRRLKRPMLMSLCPRLRRPEALATSVEAGVGSLRALWRWSCRRAADADGAGRTRRQRTPCWVALL